MYAKLFSRITESSLMEEDIPVRYTFVMLLAIADLKGYVIGTDIAISRRLNIPFKEFERCISELNKVDPDSNSEAEEGRRVIPSDCERGYKIVNYESYRDVRDEEERREYMRKYMQEYRKRPLTSVNSVSSGELLLANTTTDTTAYAEAYAEEKITLEQQRGLRENGRKKAISSPKLSDEDFLKALKENKAYSGIDIDRELCKMDAWLLTPRGKGRKRSRQFVVNWLNRQEAKMEDRPKNGASKKLASASDVYGI